MAKMNWLKFIQAVYKEMKAKNPKVKLPEAMKEAKKRWARMNKV